LVGQYDLRWRFAMLAPDECRYTLFVEGDVPDGFAERLDIALRSNNQYAYCRDLGQLDEPNVFHIARDAWPIYVRRLVSLDQRLGDIKPISLSPLTGWRDVFSPNVQPSSFS
jgi:hypothetical protein